MIDEKKLIKEIEKIDLHGRMREYEGLRAAVDIIKNQPKVGDWIACSERLPEIRQDCLVTAKYTGFMGMHGIWVKTGHMESENDWWGDCAGGEVIAWMPLPESYNPGTERKQTNGDRIRAMSDEELDEMFTRLLSANEVRSAIVCED